MNGSNYKLMIESQHFAGSNFDLDSSELGEVQTNFLPFSVELPEDSSGIAIIRTGVGRWQKFVAPFEEVELLNEAGKSTPFVQLRQNFDSIFNSIIQNNNIFEFSWNEDVYELEKIGSWEFLFPLSADPQSDCEQHIHCNYLDNSPKAWRRPINGIVKFPSISDEYWAVRVILKHRKALR